MKSLQGANVSEENLEDVFKICARAFKIFAHNRFDCLLQEKGVEVRRRWLIDRLEQQGPCAKIAYVDGRPVAQISYCPEETMPYIRNPRKDVVNILCIYNSFPEAQRKGVATALVKDLVDECDSGLSCFRGRPCRFVVTLPFPREERLLLTEFYEKYGFRQGHKEMFLEIKGEYVPRDIPEYHPLPGDLDRTIILYNPACEWGYFYAFKVEELIQEMDPDHPVEIYNIWERPEEYVKRSHQRVTAGRAIVKGQVISGGIFWTDREAFRREVEEALANTM
jgi:GNAT superfamily N-acetyltransferase